METINTLMQSLLIAITVLAILFLYNIKKEHKNECKRSKRKSIYDKYIRK